MLPDQIKRFIIDCNKVRLPGGAAQATTASQAQETQAATSQADRDKSS